MIIQREFAPAEDELIYHYCDSFSFYSICTNKKLWFNDVFSMNDFLEVHWGYSVWEQAASTRIEKYGREFLDEINTTIRLWGFRGLSLANCFSTDKDVLSQWRAYTGDGKGYVIWFNAKDLLGLPVRALKVLYDEQEQVKEAAVAIDALHAMKQDQSPDFEMLCEFFNCDLSAFKNPAFSEEKEIRLIHLLELKPSNDSLKLIDVGGIYFGQEKKGEEIKFRMKQDIPTPYIEFDFTDGGKLNPIKEVIIGPKNDVLPTAISIFLETIGIGNVSIEKSKASYR